MGGRDWSEMSWKSEIGHNTELFIHKRKFEFLILRFQWIFF